MKSSPPKGTDSEDGAEIKMDMEFNMEENQEE